MVPEATVLIVSDDHGRFAPLRAGAERLEQLHNVLLTALNVCVARMLVHLAEGLDEGDGRQRSRTRGRDEFGLVFQMLRFRCGSIGEVRKVGKGLVMELKERVGVSGKRIGPAA